MMASHAAGRDWRVAKQAGLAAAAIDPQAPGLVAVETGHAPAAAEVAPQQVRRGVEAAAETRVVDFMPDGSRAPGVR